MEMAYPVWRGRLGGLLAVGILGSNTTSVWLSYGASFVDVNNSFAWRFPLSFQAVPSILVLIACIFSPESPRWLISRDRAAEGYAILKKYHGDGRDTKMVQLEYAEIIQSIKLDGADKRWWDFRPLFSSKVACYRTFLICSYMAIIQWSGNTVALYFLPVLLTQAGVSSFHVSLLITVLTSTVGLILTVFASAFMIESYGRKNMVLTCLGSVMILMAIIAGIQSTGTPTNALRLAGVAMIIVFRLCFTFFLTPVEQFYGIEFLNHEIRAKGQGFASLFSTALLFGATYASPVALQNLAWKYYLVFIAIDVVFFAMVVFMYIETSGLTVEEVEGVLHSPSPVKASRIAQRNARINKPHWWTL